MSSSRNPFEAKSDQGSRPKSEQAHKRTEKALPEADPWPRGSKGSPMMKISFAASELLPTGQYANVAIGPCQVVAFVDTDRELDGDGYFSTEEKETLAQALNELAEVVESDVVAVQRGLVEKSLQADD